jgi:rSAM/selenodomain-associated transferase 1
MNLARLVVFARQPIRGGVKTRLAQDIGPDAALEFYIETLHGILGRLARDAHWTTQVAVTPDAAQQDPAFAIPGVEVIAQGDGDLGERLARMLAQASVKSPLIVVGSDVPRLAPQHVHTALAALRTHPLALGPSPDGGYWLIGASAPPAADLFKGVRWSTVHTRADTLRNCNPGDVALLTELEDVDDVASYRRVMIGTAGT